MKDKKESRACKYEKIVLGIDQSYKNTGVSVCADGELKNISSIRLEGLSCNSERREKLHSVLSKIIEKLLHKADKFVIIIERIRLSSQGFINIDYIKSIGALNAVIVDLARSYDIPVFSVDTRSWKSQIVGTSKPKANKLGINPEKWPTIQYIDKLGFGHKIRYAVSKQKKKGVFEYNGQRMTYNDDAADSACIALYGFLPKDRQKLEEEH